MTNFDLGFELDGTHVVVTGGAGQIGQRIVTAFLAAGAYVSGFDLNQKAMILNHERLSWQTVDVTNEISLEKAFEQARLKFGVVAACIAAAGLDLSFIPHQTSICELPLEQWQRTLNVNTTGTFLTARTWLRGIRDHAQPEFRNVAMVIFGSEAGVFGVPGNADYASSKAAIQYGLTRSLAPEATRIFARARVNAVAPGPVNTPQFRKECEEDHEALYRESEATVASRHSVPIDAVARTCLVLVSETYSESITGQIIQVDGGKSGRLLWQANGQPNW